MALSAVWPHSSHRNVLRAVALLHCSIIHSLFLTSVISLPVSSATFFINYSTTQFTYQFLVSGDSTNKEWVILKVFMCSILVKSYFHKSLAQHYYIQGIKCSTNLTAIGNKWKPQIGVFQREITPLMQSCSYYCHLTSVNISSRSRNNSVNNNNNSNNSNNITNSTLWSECNANFTDETEHVSQQRKQPYKQCAMSRHLLFITHATVSTTARCSWQQHVCQHSMQVFTITNNEHASTQYMNGYALKKKYLKPQYTALSTYAYCLFSVLLAIFVVVVSGMQLSDCTASYVDIILHRGRFWAKSAAY